MTHDRPITPRLPWLRTALAGSAAAGAALALYLFDPAHSPFYPRCYFHQFTGLHCPGCGTTRALHQLLNGHVRAAFALNPLAMVALPCLAASYARDLWARLRGRKVARRPIPSAWIWALAVVVIAFGIARNIPCEPFTRLAP
jgi:hypothetical protein